MNNKENNRWNEHAFKFSYEIDSDTLFISNIGGSDGLFFGPILFPIFPVFLWGTNNWDKLFVVLSIYTENEIELSSADIHFVINKETEVYPIKISQMKKNEGIQNEVFLDVNTFCTNESKSFCFYFDEKLNKIKLLNIWIEQVKVNDVYHKVTPLRLKRKYRLEYKPCFLN